MYGNEISTVDGVLQSMGGLMGLLVSALGMVLLQNEGKKMKRKKLSRITPQPAGAQ